MKKHMSILGIGPVYVGLIGAATAAALLLDRAGVLPVWEIPALRVLLQLLGILLMALFLPLWISGAILSKLGDNIRRDRLVTTGIYAWVRNPIYSAFLFFMWGLLLWNGNLALLVLCPFQWLLMPLLLRPTEEKWLLERYGDEYRDYCARVNRCIPWIPRL